MTVATYFKTGQALPLPNTTIAPQTLCPSNAPLVLLPVRLETRFFKLASGATELRIRVFPDQIHIDSHEPQLTTDERSWGAAYWRQDWAAADNVIARADAWRALASRYGDARAAWIARTLRPTNMAQRTAKPPVAPVFPTLPPVAAGGEDAWRSAPKARLLPDHWVAMAHSGGKLAITATGKPVRKPLAVGPDPQAPAIDAKTDAAVRAGAALPIDAGMKWMVDYDEAEAAGMALRMTVPPDVLAAGIDSLVVVGVSTAAPADTAAQLADLLDAHAYTHGLEFLRLGAPTNNTEDQRSGFSTDDPDHQLSFQREVLNDPGKAPNAASFGRALGLPDARIAPTLGHIGQADGDHDRDLRSMNTAVWPVGWGYFLSTMIGPQAGITTDILDWARSHFLSSVRGLGPLPAIRVGRQPYGVLPVTSLDLWAASATDGAKDAWMVGALKALREQVWRPVLGRVGRLGLRKDPPDPDADLADALATEAVSHGYSARRVLGGQFLRHLNAIQNMDMGAALGAQFLTSSKLLSVLGLATEAAKRPHVAGAFFEPASLAITVPLVQAGDPQPDETLASNYIQDLLKPAPINALAAQTRSSSLFEALLRQGLLRSYAAVAARIYATTGPDYAGLLADAELVDMVDLPRDNFVLKTPPATMHWQRQLDKVVKPITGTNTIRAFLEGLKDFSATPVAELGDYRAALTWLSGLDTERLNFLLQSTLDLSSHRLDAWITSAATKRLTAMRNAAPAGQYVGAYGWVENLHPADAPTQVPDASLPPGEAGPLVRPADESGFIHAPSMTHAAAAALLRNAHLGPTGAPGADDPFAIDLSSRRVREANRLLAGVRSGQPLGALLGYRLERRLHDAGLSALIAPLRKAAPLVLRDRGDGVSDPKALGANNVVDGLALAHAYKAAPQTFVASVLPAAVQADRDLAQRELDALLDDLDGLSDALTAETAYQLARGNSTRLGATLAAVAEGSAPPPELEVARIPRTGVSLTHRVAVLFDDKLPPATGWADPASSPLSRTDGPLNLWVGRQLVDPHKVRCTVERLSDDGKSVVQSLAFPLSELGLTPLDVIYGLDDTASPAAAGASLSHLEQLVLYTAQRRKGGFGATNAMLRLQPARPADLAAGEITLGDLIEQARGVSQLLGRARGLRPDDLSPPERASQGAIDLAGLQARVKAGEDALAAVHQRLTARVKAGGAAADDLRADLLALGAFGLRPAAPVVALGDTPDIRSRLQRQAAALLAISGPRLDQAAAVRTAPAAPDARGRLGQLLDYSRAVFGPALVLLPQFTCDAAGAAELKSAIAAGPQQQGGDPLAVHRWFLQSGQVRDAVAALGRCLRGSEVLGSGDRLALNIAQLPFDATERWVGLAPLPRTDLAASKLSLALQAPAAPDTTRPLAGLFVDEWVEVVPSASETTALTFQFDPPNAVAPQNILLAVPPAPGQDWTTESLRQVLMETLDLAKLRAVDPALLGAAAQYLPGLYLPFNAAGHAASTNVAPLTV